MCRLLNPSLALRLGLVWALLLCAAPRSSAQTCGTDSDASLQQKRRQILRASILSQLNMVDAPDLNATRTFSDEETKSILAAYYALRNSSDSLERDRERVCRSQDFFAKPVTSFAAISPPPEETQNSTDRGKRTAGSSSRVNQYTIYFNFDLPDNRSDVSRGDLLLYQLQSKAGSSYVTVDQTQYVEVNAFARSLDIRTTVEGKYIDVSDSGYQVFDITSTLKLWISHDVKGTVSFEVTVYCYSSAGCNQQTSDGFQPTRVEFYTGFSQQDKTPRLMTVSNSVSDSTQNGGAEGPRQRRQAPPSSGVGFCQAQQTTCCLKPLTIRFREDLDFTFILQPLSYVANYCTGKCVTTAGGNTMTPTLYQFLSQLGSSNPGSSVEPCCAGNTYLPLDVMLVQNNRVKIIELQQVTVTSCRCT